MDRGTWWATVHGIAKSQTQLSDKHSIAQDYSLLGSSLQGIFQARILEWVFATPGDLPDPGIEPVTLASPALAGRFFTTVPPGKVICLLVTQFSFPDLENPGVPLCFSLVPSIHSPQA